VDDQDEMATVQATLARSCAKTAYWFGKWNAARQEVERLSAELAKKK
jgi:hypothetical protein